MNNIQYKFNPLLNNRIISWQQYQEYTDALAEVVHETFYPDIIVGIFQGGYIVMQSLADYFSNSRLAGLHINFFLPDQPVKLNYTDEGQGSEIYDLKHKKVLVVDEVVDSGKTLHHCINQLMLMEPKHIKTACLFYNRNSIQSIDFSFEQFNQKVNYILPWRYRRDRVGLLADILKNQRGLSTLKIKDKVFEKYQLQLNNSAIEEELKKYGNIFHEEKEGWYIINHE